MVSGGIYLTADCIYFKGNTRGISESHTERNLLLQRSPLNQGESAVFKEYWIDDYRKKGGERQQAGK